MLCAIFFRAVFFARRPIVPNSKAIYNEPAMDAPTNLPEQTPPPPEPARSEIQISGSEVSAGGDIVGGDVHVAGDSIRGQAVTVQQGFSFPQVQRLVLIVGGLVFATALVFFVVGALSAAALLNVLNRPVQSSPQAAREMQQKISEIQNLPPGSDFRQVFAEDEISSYFRFVLGPQLGIREGKARLMDEPGQIALGGNLASAGGLPFLAQLEVTTGAVPFQVKRTWLKVIPTPEGVNFGWIIVPTPALKLQQALNADTFGQVQFTRIGQSGGGTGKQPEIGTNLILWGVVK